MKTYAAIAAKTLAIDNCIKVANWEWKERHEEAIQEIMQLAPSGGGIDMGTQFLASESTPNRLVFQAAFHHMDEVGGYDGWTDHKIIVTPSLWNEFDVRITGRNRNEIKEYLGEIFSAWLGEEAEEPAQVVVAA
jgi:hypothetical protein